MFREGIYDSAIKPVTGIDNDVGEQFFTYYPSYTRVDSSYVCRCDCCGGYVYELFVMKDAELDLCCGCLGMYRRNPEMVKLTAMVNNE